MRSGDKIGTVMSVDVHGKLEEVMNLLGYELCDANDEYKFKTMIRELKLKLILNDGNVK